MALAAAAPAAMLAWSRALAGAGGRGARLAWASAWTLAGVAGLVALGWSRAQGLPGLLGSRAGHLALASSARWHGPGRRMAVAARGGYGFP